MAWGLNSFVIQIDAIRNEFNPNKTKGSIYLLDCGAHKKMYASVSFMENIDTLQITNWVQLKRNTGKTATVYNITIDLCDFLENNYNVKNLIFNVVMKLFKKFLKGLPSKCPLKKNKTLLLRGFYFDEDMFPPYIPDTNFTGFIGLSQRNSSLLKSFITARVESKAKQGFRKDNKKIDKQCLQ
ncbi:uncharacterized protein LOC131995685 [Stomoxys calcitrans]|uniref:uncharacterized protein LOC131995685 n=1 Tax=Stomoxys calcitrans TaxID=35570 RepID=UPI0027E32851|nr:uncharacterized protein LOC131995685 [Stomoxys calcitrans]